jgi:hypothetical protein
MIVVVVVTVGGVGLPECIWQKYVGGEEMLKCEIKIVTGLYVNNWHVLSFDFKQI